MKKLDLRDISVSERDWKVYKASATQDELLILGIGTKYRLLKRRWVSYLSALGIIVSVILGILWLGTSIGLIILIGGYALCSFLATKFIRYRDSYGKIYRKLDKENRQVLDSVFRTNVALAILDAIISFFVMYATIPYQAVMMFIGLVAPKFVISKSGVLFSIPKGCDVGTLSAASDYYASFSLLDEWEKTSYKNSHRYTATFTNDMGYHVEIHSRNGVDFYDDSGTHYVSHDHGKTVTKQ